MHLGHIFKGIRSKVNYGSPGFFGLIGPGLGTKVMPGLSQDAGLQAGPPMPRSSFTRLVCAPTFSDVLGSLLP